MRNFYYIQVAKVRVQQCTLTILFNIARKQMGESVDRCSKYQRPVIGRQKGNVGFNGMQQLNSDIC